VNRLLIFLAVVGNLWLILLVFGWTVSISSMAVQYKASCTGCETAAVQAALHHAMIFGWRRGLEILLPFSFLIVILAVLNIVLIIRYSAKARRNSVSRDF